MTKDFFAIPEKDLSNARAAVGFDQLIEIGKWPAQALGQGLSYRGFARPHEPDQSDDPARTLPVRERRQHRVVHDFRQMDLPERS